MSRGWVLLFACALAACDERGLCERDACAAACIEECAADPSAPFCAQTARCGADSGAIDSGRTDTSVPLPCGGACAAEYCVGGTCVECTAATAAQDCDGAACVEGRCVQCTGDAECDESAPICGDDGMCRACGWSARGGEGASCRGLPRVRRASARPSL